MQSSHKSTIPRKKNHPSNWKLGTIEKSRNQASHGSRDFRQLPWILWVLPKAVICRDFFVIYTNIRFPMNSFFLISAQKYSHHSYKFTVTSELWLGVGTAILRMGRISCYPAFVLINLATPVVLVEVWALLSAILVFCFFVFVRELTGKIFVLTGTLNPTHSLTHSLNPLAGSKCPDLYRQGDKSVALRVAKRTHAARVASH